MYWVQTQYNLNNIMEPLDILENCQQKEIPHLIVGDEGPYSWFEFEQHKNAYPTKIHYAILKRNNLMEILWLLKGDIFRSASLLEKAYKKRNYNIISINEAMPMLVINGGEGNSLKRNEQDYINKLEKQFGSLPIIETQENKERINKLGKEKQVLVLHRVRFIEPIDKELSDLRRNISDESTATFRYDEFLKPPQFLDKRIERTKAFLDNWQSTFIFPKEQIMRYWNEERLLNLKPIDLDSVFERKFPLPDNELEIKKIHLLVTESGKGFNKYYRNHPHKDRVLQMLKKELTVICEQDFYEYFLIIHDIFRYARQENIQLSVRGSVVGSVLSRCLGFNEIDPTEYNLKFERFLNPYRNNKPDIDIEVPAFYHERIMTYIRKKYGEENVAKIITYQSFGWKSSIEYLRKEEGITSKIEDYIPAGTKNVSYFFTTPRGKNVVKRYKQEGYLSILKKAKFLHKKVQSRSTQKASFVIDERLQRLPVATIGGENVITFVRDNKHLESLAFTKVDLLPSRVLEVIYNTWSQLTQSDREKYNFNDHKTYQLLREQNKDYVFQLKSKGIHKVMEEINPRTLNDIMLGLALYRPGPKEQQNKLYRNKMNKIYHLTDDNGNEIPDTDELTPILKETFGIIIYQEQVMEIAQVWSGFSLGEADLLRDAISKKKVNLMEELKHSFFDRAKSIGRSEDTTNYIFKLIEKFSEYGFGKSHAAEYATITYETAYLKANHPKEFFASLLNDNIKKFKICARIKQELKEKQIPLVAANIKFPIKYFKVIDGRVHQGMMNIPGLNEKDIDLFLQEFKKHNGDIQKMKISRDLVKKLKTVGFF